MLIILTRRSPVQSQGVAHEVGSIVVQAVFLEGAGFQQICGQKQEQKPKDFEQNQFLTISKHSHP